MSYEITPQEVQQRQESNEAFTLLDVREPWEREKASLGGEHIPMSEIPTRMQELDPDGEIVIYCHHGVRSLSVADWLYKQGFAHVRSLAGGIDRWSMQIDPQIPRY